MPLHLATSSLATSVSLLREVALAFKRAVLEPPGHPINLPSKLIVPNADLRQYSSMDVMTSLGTGCPMSFQYDVTYSDPVLGASGVFDAADALGLQWMYGCPEFFIILLARMHNIRDDATRRIDVQEVGEIEQSIRGWQPRYPLSQDPHLAVARLAVQECWRQTLLIYLYMGICKTTSDDPRVQDAHRSFMKLIKTVQPRRIPDLFLLLPFFVVSVASCHTADRNKIYGRMRNIRECRTSGTAGSDLVDMVVDIWRRADSENRPALYAELPVSQIAHFSELHPKPDRYKFSYGTAGFRTAADTLDSVLFRVGVIAGLRSKRLDGKTIGVMVTASHNPEHKCSSSLGRIRDGSGECPSTEEFIDGCNHLVTSLKIDISKPAHVLYARDTRPSGPALVKALEDGINSVGAVGRNEGVQTTPMVHYLATKQAPSPLVVDCANGVGYLAIKEFAPYVQDILKFIPINTAIDTQGALNHQAGADYVKTQQRMPPSVAENLKILQRACSFDGDADRLIYYYVDDQRQFRLLDGDKIAALVAGFFADVVKAAGLAGKIEVGIVQTAYANGNSTKYLSSRLPVKCTPTGVKHLHHAAQRFGIGVYFEANGHGTVLFSHQTLELLDSHQPGTPSNASHLNTLRNLRDLINQTVGDALSDLLLCEVVLAHRLYTPVEWDSLYADLPNRLLKVQVRDRSIFTTEDAERRLATPVGLQKMIDDTVRKYESGRSFVRPSGTEDVVRIYAECSNVAQVDELANRVARLVYEHGEIDQFGRPRETY
ncbi:Phosphoglucomutase/phosphomannomutase, C-terminal domain [Rhizoctonia solani]|uniref:Phosphoglucomutase/phosphomannomutase, C-terminal domain n=1 Tax=Rhizoctonia solani TaxID=456999 RepID=A0A8H7M632_9AGAM|nr:Phosphoglucomutase/phosphomannomutase, C-terminal domain [Rhizoctonia solani]